jgi:hypothetical protein
VAVEGEEEEEAMRRHTFIVQVHPGGVSVVENLRTRERMRVTELDRIGAQIERWVSEMPGERGPADGAGLVPSEDAPQSSGAVDHRPDQAL